MGGNDGLQNYSPPQRADGLAFFAFLVSGIFILLAFSPFFLFLLSSAPLFLREQFPSTSSSIIFIYILPWMLLWPAYSLEVINNRAYRVEIILMGSVIVLGMVNVAFSDDVKLSYHAMIFFLLSGILPLWTSMFVLTNQRHLDIFNLFCCCILFIISSSEITYYIFHGKTFIFMYNEIFFGSLLIILSLGPLSLLLSTSFKLKIVGLTLISLVIILTIITEKRGSLLAITTMAVIWIFRRDIKPTYISIALLITICLFTFLTLTVNKLLDRNIPSHFNIIHRLELYPFALHVFQKHPWFGIGLRPYTHQKYLLDYEQINQEHIQFSSTVKRLQTFDNMYLTSFVELGTIMSICYYGLIFYIIYKYCHYAQFNAFSDKKLLLLLPIIGLAVHSLTYDSLLFPQINWLFHVQLGILSVYSQIPLKGARQ